MKKILLLAGVVGCCVLLLGGFILIGDFAHFLGQETKKIVEGKDDRFIGTWDIENEEEQLIFHSSGTVSGHINGIYEVYEEILFINVSSGDALTTFEYNFYFSDNNTELILSEASIGTSLILNKI